MLTVAQLTAIKEGLDAKMSSTEIRAKVGVGLNSVYKVRMALAKHKFDELLEKAGQATKNKIDHRQRLALVTRLIHEGSRNKDIMAKLGISSSQASYWAQKVRSLPKQTQGPRRSKEIERLRNNVLHLKGQGLRVREIATRLGISKSTAHHYMYYKLDKLGHPKPLAIVPTKTQGEPTHNGNPRENPDHQPGRFDYFAAGYTTRTLEVFAQGADRNPAVFTERVLNIIAVGTHPVRKLHRGPV